MTLQDVEEAVRKSMQPQEFTIYCPKCRERFIEEKRPKPSHAADLVRWLDRLGFEIVAKS